jgi:protein-disulfide isomerase
MNHSLLSVPVSAQDHVQGALDATVMLVMYGDYPSPQSAQVYHLITVIQQQLSATLGTNYFGFAYRYFPQIQIYPDAQNAAAAAAAAGAQRQFWQMHNLLFAHQQSLGNGYLVEYANRLGLDVCQFLRDMSQQVYVARINQDIESGHQSGVIVDPALFINGVRYSERWDIELLQAAIIAVNH